MTSVNKLVQEKLRERINLIASTADHIPGVIIIHSLPDLNILFMSKLGLQSLGKSWSEIKLMSYEDFQTRFFNEEANKEATVKIVELLERNTDEVASYFQQVRTSDNEELEWYKSTTKVLHRDDENRPVAIITVSQRIDSQHYFTSKAIRLLEENDFLKKHHQQFDSLTKRERMILKLLAAGKSAPQIAKELSISIATAETHRKKIRKKLEARNSHDLGMYARAFDLI